MDLSQLNPRWPPRWSRLSRFCFTFSLHIESRFLARVDISHPGNKGENQDDRQDDRGYQGCLYLQFYCTKFDLYVNTHLLCQ